MKLMLKVLLKEFKGLTKIPICSGFGIKSPEDASKIAKTGCQGVIVGSAFSEVYTRKYNGQRFAIKFRQIY